MESLRTLVPGVVSRLSDHGGSVLDFGCGAGRMIRHFEDLAPTCHIWGVDVSERHVAWCEENLSPPFHFMRTTAHPHLPFEDRSFDLAELPRTIERNPGDAFVRRIRRTPGVEERLRGGVGKLVLGEGSTADVLYDRGWLERSLKGLFASVELFPEACGYQTVVVLEKERTTVDFAGSRG